MKYKDYIYNLENPIIFDHLGKFVYFPINKNAQTSVARNLLKGRVIIRKDSINRWQNHFNKTDFSKIYKFGIVRNPYHRFISAYFYLRDKYPERVFYSKDINYFIKKYIKDIKNPFNIDPHLQKQKPELYCKDKKLVDDIFYLENLEKNFRFLAEKILLDKDLVIENEGNIKDYSKVLDSESKKIVFDVYAEDFDTFDYRPADI